jgi:serine/threonine-protein kinase
MALESGQLTVIAPSGKTRVLAPSSGSKDAVAGSVNFPHTVAGDRFMVGVIRGGPIVVISAADGAMRRVRRFAAADTALGIIGSAPKAAGGRLYWLERDVVMSAAFDASDARLTTEPTPVVSGVRGDLLGAADFDVADDGTVVFVAGTDPSIGPLAWLDRQGRVDTLPLPPADYGGFDLSPDGRSILTKSFTTSGAAEIRIFDLARRTGTLLDVGTGDISQPGWTADGRFILVSVAPQGVSSARVLRVPIDGRSPPDTIMEGGLDRMAVSRDGRAVILEISRTRSPNRYLTVAEDMKLFASRDGGAFEEMTSLRKVVAPSLSPDGKWVTYEKYGVGQGEIYIERFPLDGHPRRVPSDGGYEALFSAKGDRIFYRVGLGIMEVPLTISGDTVALGTPKPYVKFAFADFLGRGYKVGNDDRILVKLLPSTAPQSEIRVMTGSR